jgi:hypothetical protein
MGHRHTFEAPADGVLIKLLGFRYVARQQFVPVKGAVRGHRVLHFI